MPDHDRRRGEVSWPPAMRVVLALIGLCAVAVFGAGAALLAFDGFLLWTIVTDDEPVPLFAWYLAVLLGLFAVALFGVGTFLVRTVLRGWPRREPRGFEVIAREAPTPTEPSARSGDAG